MLLQMKGTAIELPKSSKKLILPTLTLFLLTTVLLYWPNSWVSSIHALKIKFNGFITTSNSTIGSQEHKCNIYSGTWVPHDSEPYYMTETKCLIDDRQNCMKFGRPDTKFMKWRWKPDECELPLFDAVQFLELVRNKTLAFVGDSVARNQMQSLECLLASAADPVDVTYGSDTRFRRWLYPDYNFTMVALWSPTLVKTRDADPNGFSANSFMNLYLDEVDESWTTQIENVDIAIISAGQWFLRPFIFYEKGQVVGCNMCHKQNVLELGYYYGYRMALRTALRTLVNLQNYTGLTFLRTFSPSHFENGDWNKGGNCVRTIPFTKLDPNLDGYSLLYYLTQVDEFRAAEKEAEKRDLKFRLLDTTRAMMLRADGHPNHYGHWPQENNTVADCVHWCLPGPIDTWNEFLLQMLKMEGEELIDMNLQKRT